MISRIYELAEDVVTAVSLWMTADIDDDELMSDGFQKTMREMQVKRHNALCDMADEYNNWTDGFQRMQPVADGVDEFYTKINIIDEAAVRPYERIAVEERQLIGGYQ